MAYTRFVPGPLPYLRVRPSCNSYLVSQQDFLKPPCAPRQYRWGDAPLRFLEIELFINASRVHHFCDCASSKSLSFLCSNFLS